MTMAGHKKSQQKERDDYQTMMNEKIAASLTVMYSHVKKIIYKITWEHDKHVW